MNGNDVGEVKEAMLVTVAEDGKTEKVVSLQGIQEIEIEVESDKQIPEL